MNYYFKTVFSVISALSLAQSAYYFHSQFSHYVNYAKAGDASSFSQQSILSSYEALVEYLVPATDGDNSTFMGSGTNGTFIPDSVAVIEETPKKHPWVEAAEKQATSKSPQVNQKKGRGNRNKKNKKENGQAKNSTLASAPADEPQRISTPVSKPPDEVEEGEEESKPPSVIIPQPETKNLSPQTSDSPAALTGTTTTIHMNNATFGNLSRRERRKIDRDQKRANEKAQHDQDAVLQFYKHHEAEMFRLVNDTTLMDWNRYRRKRGKYSQFLDNFKSFFIPLKGDADAVNLAQHLPNVTQYDFFLHPGNLCKIAKIFAKYHANPEHPPLPHVMMARMNQDFGALSSDIHGKTARFHRLTKVWKQEGCSEAFIFDYINHPDTLAVFTNQFQIYNHPKVISLPVGLGPGVHNKLMEEIRTLQARNRQKEDKATTAQEKAAIYERPQLLMINAKLRDMREKAVTAVTTHFRQAGYPSIQNTYGHYTNETCETPDNPKLCYYRELQRSKFILSPGGLGLDCYRNWEALYLGCIPVLERNFRTNDGWFNRTLADLPVAWIDDYNDLTPEYLQQEYRRLVLDADPTQYKYEKLTRHYWIELAHSHVHEHKKKRNQ